MFKRAATRTRSRSAWTPILRFMLLAEIVVCCACSHGPTLTPQQEALKDPASRAKVISSLHIGDTREKVEGLLGQPSSEMMTADDAQVSYSFGMEEMMESMRPSPAASIGSSVLGTLSGLAGFAGPAGGIAAEVGTGVASAAMQGGGPNPMDGMNKIETVSISYHNGVVAALSRNRGGMGAMMNAFGGGVPMGGMPTGGMPAGGMPAGGMRGLPSAAGW